MASVGIAKETSTSTTKRSSRGVVRTAGKVEFATHVRLSILAMSLVAPFATWSLLYGAHSAAMIRLCASGSAHRVLVATSALAVSSRAGAKSHRSVVRLAVEETLCGATRATAQAPWPFDVVASMRFHGRVHVVILTMSPTSFRDAAIVMLIPSSGATSVMGNGLASSIYARIV